MSAARLFLVTLAMLSASSSLAACGGSTRENVTANPGTPSLFTIPLGIPKAMAPERTPLPSGWSPQISSQSETTVDSANIQALLYVAQHSKVAIAAYAADDRDNKPPICKVPVDTNLTSGMRVNSQHILYVTLPFLDEVATFGPHCGKAGPILHDPNGTPVSVAFDDKTGTVYVCDPSIEGIDVYENGALMPSRTLINAEMQDAAAVAVDSFGNVFESSTFTSKIVEFPGGHRKGSMLLGVTGLGEPSGLEIDHENNLIVVDDLRGILIFAPPYNGAAKTHINTRGHVESPNLDHSNRNLYISNSTYHGIDVYSYPSGKHEYTITNSVRMPGGIALDPES